MLPFRLATLTLVVTFALGALGCSLNRTEPEPPALVGGGFHYETDDAERSVVHVPWAQLGASAVGPLTSWRRYWFDFEFDRSTWLYLFQFDSALGVSRLFPDADKMERLENPLAAGRRHEIPPHSAFLLLPVPGEDEARETIVAVFALERRQDIEETYRDLQELEQEADADDSDVEPEALQRAHAKLFQALTETRSGSRGLLFNFDHLASKAVREPTP